MNGYIVGLIIVWSAFETLSYAILSGKRGGKYVNLILMISVFLFALGGSKIIYQYQKNNTSGQQTRNI